MKRFALSFVSILPLALGFVACDGALDLGDRPDAGTAEASTPPQQVTPPDNPWDTYPAENVPDATPDATPDPFTIRGAYSFDRFSPMAQRQVRGVMITTFADACNQANANVGGRVIYITFSADVPAIPPVGTYPLSTVGADETSTALAQVWNVTASGCTGMEADGAFVTGNLVITQSDETGMTGSFEGAVAGTGPSAIPMSGSFVAPRCPPAGGACNP